MDDLEFQVILTAVGELKGEIGELTGEMKGIGREIGDLKTLMAQSNQNCILCKTDLRDKITNLEVHGAHISQENAADIVVIRDSVNHLEAAQNACQEVEAAKTHWIDSSFAKFVAIITVVLSIFGAVKTLL